MIYTVTVNPSIDYIMYLDAFSAGELNRSKSEAHLTGGKGINVSRVLHSMGLPTTCLGFCGGYVGDEIIRQLSAEGIPSDFVRVPGCTRINVKVKSDAGRETEINGNGPSLTENELSLLAGKLDVLKPGDVLILSGSVPGNVSRDIYKELGDIAVGHGAELVADAEKSLLFPALSCHPLLIKPNKAELEGMLGRQLQTPEEIKEGLLALREKGARHILLSMGGDGAYFLSENDDFYYLPAPSGKVVNTVGSGDSMVAGFTGSYLLGLSLPDCAKYAVAAGSAGAFKEDLPLKEDIQALLPSITAKKL